MKFNIQMHTGKQNKGPPYLYITGLYEKLY